ncbi:MAG: electron transport complex subunit RsxC [Crocinitomicaceae bacterium]|nr:electron transport complex subunit RsxC [Crocinitomicaceae bacterium]|tara:strand:- start:1560 stop:2807 length:1248 start_codon:yes stop_codon:yes gene_type:complete
MFMKIPSLKSVTKKLPITELESTDVFYIPLQAYFGTMKPLVAVGQKVQQYLPLAEGKDGSRIHAPVSGEILELNYLINENPHLVLQNDFTNTTYIDQELESATELTDKIRLAGISGSGGAGFPTHIKYKTNAIDTLIVNGVECEPYLTADYALMYDEAGEILKAAQASAQYFGAKNIVIGLEKQNKELVKIFESHSELMHGVSFKLLPNTYPQGGELQLIKAVIGKEIPKGSIPADEGVVVSNVATLLAVYKALELNQPNIDRVVTVSGEAAKHYGNFRVKIGTPIEYVLKKAGVNAANVDVVLGGPMMGKIVTDLKQPISKTSGGLLSFKKSAVKENNCIQCSYCADACPQHLMPMQFASAKFDHDTQKFIQFNVLDCIECGACQYICPSNVPLMQSISEGKSLLKSLQNSVPV